MADFRSVLAVSEAIRGVLRSSYRPEDFDNTPLEFEIYTTRGIASPIENGVSLFLYRLYIHGANRIPAGTLGNDGRRRAPLLPLELHYLVTIWAGQHTLQHSLAAWTMRTLEDNALLPATLLNAGGDSTFGATESVELTLADMRTEDLFRIWEVLGPRAYNLSIPYLARVVPIETVRTLPGPEGAPVQDRTIEFGLLTGRGERA